MTAHAWLLGLLFLVYDGNRDGAPADSADRITLRDGKVVRGLVTAMVPGPRGSVEFLVRRAWAEKTLKDHLRAGTARPRGRPGKPLRNVGNGWKPGGRNGQRAHRPATASYPGSTRSCRGWPPTGNRNRRS